MILDLTNVENSDIKYIVMKYPSGFESTFFIATGSLKIPLQEYIDKIRVNILCKIKSYEDLFILLLATNSLKSLRITNISLTLPFFPSARQDRINHVGESFSLKVMTDLINAQNYSRVTIFDPHSDVLPGLLNNCEVIGNQSLVKLALPSHSNFYIISPDAGASKKIYTLCQKLQLTNEIVQCGKIRNTLTGKIEGTSVGKDDFGGRDCYIIDDICSRGGTFIALAKELKKRNAGSIFLVVSHYENTANIDELSRDIAGIYTTNSLVTKNKEENFLIIYDVLKLIKGE